MLVGYIGLGAMGGALSRHLIGKFPLSVLDLNPSVVADFEKLGATPVSSAAEMAKRCDVVLMCLPRSADVQRVIFGPGGLIEGLTPGKILIDQTSGIPEQTREFARLLAEKGITLFDAPVSGAMATAVAGTVSIITSGPVDAYQKTQAILSTISRNVYRCGDRVGNGQTMKSVNNMMNAGCRLATLELVSMGRNMGLSLETMIEAINNTTARNFTSTGMLPAIVEGRQSTKFALALQLKDMNQAYSMGTESGTPLPVASVARGLLQVGVNTLAKGAQLEEVTKYIPSFAGTQLVERSASTPVAS